MIAGYFYGQFSFLIYPSNFCRPHLKLLLPLRHRCIQNRRPLQFDSSLPVMGGGGFKLRKECDWHGSLRRFLLQSLQLNIQFIRIQIPDSIRSEIRNGWRWCGGFGRRWTAARLVVFSGFRGALRWWRSRGRSVSLCLCFLCFLFFYFLSFIYSLFFYVFIVFEASSLVVVLVYGSWLIQLVVPANWNTFLMFLSRSSSHYYFWWLLECLCRTWECSSGVVCRWEARHITAQMCIKYSEA